MLVNLEIDKVALLSGGPRQKGRGLWLVNRVDSLPSRRNLKC